MVGRITTNNLSGKSQIQLNNLLGKNNTNSLSNVKNFKLLLLETIILPLVRKQWKTLEENLYCIDNMKKKIDYYYYYYKLEDFLIYKEIIGAFENIILEHKQLEDLEKKIYGSSKDISTIIYKTTMIRLKPEYEIYNVLFGKPDRANNESYNDIIIKDIEHLLSFENVDFKTIQNIIMDKYPNVKNK
jgi:hypothetical protein